jgi:hypothetical protein
VFAVPVGLPTCGAVLLPAYYTQIRDGTQKSNGYPDGGNTFSPISSLVVKLVDTKVVPRDSIWKA